MELRIQSTDEITHLDGVPCRAWKGTTAEGVKCVVFVHRIAVALEAESAEFERDLQEQLPPGRYVPLPVIL